MRQGSVSLSSTALLIVISIGVGFMIAQRQETLVEAKNAVPAAQPTRIGYVNIAAVLKKFDFANQAGMAITKRRKEFVDEIQTVRLELAKEEKELNGTTDKNLKEQIEGRCKDLNGAKD